MTIELFDGQNDEKEIHLINLAGCVEYELMYRCVDDGLLPFHGEDPWIRESDLREAWIQTNLIKQTAITTTIDLPEEAVVLQQAQKGYKQAASMMVDLGVDAHIMNWVLMTNDPSRVDVDASMLASFRTNVSYTLGLAYLKRYVQLLNGALLAQGKSLTIDRLIETAVTATAAHEITHMVDDALALRGVVTIHLADSLGFLDYARAYLPILPQNRINTFHREHLARGVEVTVLSQLLHPYIDGDIYLAEETAESVFIEQRRQWKSAESLVTLLRAKGWSLTKIDNVAWSISRLMPDITGAPTSISPMIMESFAYGHPPYSLENLEELLGL
jgi:hypothetical protein